MNIEPAGYNKKAISLWESVGTYRECSWANIDQLVLKDKVNVLIVRLGQFIGKTKLECFPNLSYLITATTGLDHIDNNELDKRNIKLISLKGEDDFLSNIPSTAEHTWALLLALIRNLPQANEHVKMGMWDRDLFRGHQLKDKVLGIVGMGRTGTMVANYAQAFNMKILYYDPFVDSNIGVKTKGLKELFSQSDIISLHLHLTENTAGLITKDVIKHAKKDALIINTSRGKIWDENAIVNALKKSDIAGVATDVLSSEHESIVDNPLWKAFNKGYNVIITPHIGGATREAMWACEEFIANKTITHIIGS